MTSRERNILRAWMRVALGLHPDDTVYTRGLQETARYYPTDDRIVLDVAGANVILLCKGVPWAVEILRAFGLPIL